MCPYSLIPSGDHRTHRQAHILVRVDHIGQDLGGARHRNPLLVPQLVDAAVLGEHALPELAVGRAARHRAQQVGIDLDDLFDGLGGDVGAAGGARVNRHDHAALVLERQRCRAALEVDLHGRVLLFVPLQKGLGVVDRRPFDAAYAGRDELFGLVVFFA